MGGCQDTLNEGDLLCSFDPLSTAPERSREMNVAEEALEAGSWRILL